MASTSPVFLKSYDLLVWLLGRTRQFPRDQRFVMGRRIEECALDYYDGLVAAAKAGPGRAAAAVERADVDLERLRHYLRLAKDLKLLSFAQYEHAAERLVELGKLTGGWLRKARSRRQEGARPA